MFNRNVVFLTTLRFIHGVLATIKRKDNQMTRIALSNFGNSPFEKLIGHNKDILTKWIDLEKVIFESSSLSNHILEQVRTLFVLSVVLMVKMELIILFVCLIRFIREVKFH